MKRSLAGKTVLLTGASGGFGVHFLRQLLARRCHVIATDLDQAILIQTAHTILQEVGSGALVACLPGDLSSQAGVNALWAQIGALNRPIDVLINNAGVGLSGRHDEVPNEAWERLMMVNLMAPMWLSAHVIPQMIARQSGVIVNISSVAGWTSQPGLSAYSASKFGLRGFSVGLDAGLHQYGIQVSAVYPFFSNTPILNSPQFGTFAVESSPSEKTLRRLPTPEQVVANSLKAVEKGKLHIFPDRIGQLIYLMLRLLPTSLINRIRRFNPIERLSQT